MSDEQVQYTPEELERLKELASTERDIMRTKAQRGPMYDIHMKRINDSRAAIHAAAIKRNTSDSK